MGLPALPWLPHPTTHGPSRAIDHVGGKAECDECDGEGSAWRECLTSSKPRECPLPSVVPGLPSSNRCVLVDLFPENHHRLTSHTHTASPPSLAISPPSPLLLLFSPPPPSQSSLVSFFSCFLDRPAHLPAAYWCERPHLFAAIADAHDSEARALAVLRWFIVLFFSLSLHPCPHFLLKSTLKDQYTSRNESMGSEKKYLLPLLLFSHI